jgi:protein O-mannosyl-transferase
MIEILALSAFVYGKFRFVLFGVWWFLITLLPVSNVVEIYTLIAQRFLYLSLIGFWIAAVPL